MICTIEDSFQEHRRQGGLKSQPAAKGQATHRHLRRSNCNYMFEETIKMLLNEATSQKILLHGFGSPK
jgi:hypothetical protein